MVHWLNRLFGCFRHMAGARLYEIKVEGLEGRFFGGVSKAHEGDSESNTSEEPRSGSSGEGSEVQTVVGDGMAFKEDNFLTSANLCRWIIDYNEIQVGKQIGLGSYGVVYPGQVEGRRRGGEAVHQAEARRAAHARVPRRDGLPLGAAPPQHRALHRRVREEAQPVHRDRVHEAGLAQGHPGQQPDQARVEAEDAHAAIGGAGHQLPPLAPPGHRAPRPQALQPARGRELEREGGRLRVRAHQGGERHHDPLRHALLDGAGDHPRGEVRRAGRRVLVRRGHVAGGDAQGALCRAQLHGRVARRARGQAAADPQRLSARVQEGDEEVLARQCRQA
ncbi:hypothetical protein DB41_CF00010, partial [Neochlamydia sp. TUME1]